jgi:hypothetical protein
MLLEKIFNQGVKNAAESRNFPNSGAAGTLRRARAPVLVPVNQLL